MIRYREKMILVIDDSEDNQDLLSTIFKKMGVRTHCTSNGKEALSLLQELFILPDLILLDVQMPLMDGFQFRSEQKKSPRLANIPVIVMSAEQGADLNERMIYPAEILSKPLVMKSFLKSVEAQLVDRGIYPQMSQGYF